MKEFLCTKSHRSCQGSFTLFLDELTELKPGSYKSILAPSGLLPNTAKWRAVEPTLFSSLTLTAGCSSNSFAMELQDLYKDPLWTAFIKAVYPSESLSFTSPPRANAALTSSSFPSAHSWYSAVIMLFPFYSSHGLHLDSSYLFLNTNCTLKVSYLN